VTVALPVQHSANEYLTFPGTAEPVEQVEVKPRATGTIDEVLFTEGDPVSRDAVLYHIDPRSLQAALQRAQADLQDAQVRLEEAADEHTRYLELRDEEVISDVEYNRVRARWLSAQEQVSAARAVARDAEINLDYTEVRAPIAGRVGETMATEGNLVTAGVTTLTHIFTYDPIYVVFNLSERELLRLRERHPDRRTASVEAVVEIGLLNSTNFPLRGRVEFADLGLDPATGTYLVRATVDNPRPPAILPGQFVRVRYAVESLDNALLVPERALGLDQAGRYVLVVGADNVVAQRRVTLGPADEGMVVITEGLGPNDRVIVNGLQRARPGSPVTPQVEGSGASAPAPANPGG
jgi:multidrug efflux system membrane fusion protein